MEIREYDQVDPFDVLDLNLLCLRYELTPERVGTIRRLDPRPFPFFAIYAMEEGSLLGQVGVYRLPIVTIDGPEEVGGICAMCAHPAHSRRGVGSLLIEEAHARMRAAGLRFSALGTSRQWVAHPFYQKHGYQEFASFASALAARETALRFEDRELRSEQAVLENLAAADALFRQAAAGKTGFARRHEPFLSMMVEVGDIFGLDHLRLLRNGKDLVGYAVVRDSDAVFKVEDILLFDGTGIPDATTALLREVRAPYVLLTVNKDSHHIADLRRAGFRVTYATYDTTMVKPMADDMSVEAFCALTQVGTPRFLMSGMDVT